MAFEIDRTVEWGDCDPAGIVFYPNYFRWMDAAFHAMCRDLGFSQDDLPGGLFATPLIDSSATFRAPARMGDTLRVGVRITRLGGSGFSLVYDFVRTDTLVAEGREHRVCVMRDGDLIAKAQMPDEMRFLLEHRSEG